jgi:DNA processing protein
MDAAAELCALVAMNLASGIGWRTYSRLAERFGSAAAAVAASTETIAAVEGVGQRKAAALKAAVIGGEVEAEIALAEENGIAILPCTSEQYPEALKHIPDPPLVLYVKGAMTKEDAIGLAFVGSRRSSLYGLRATRRLAGQAARAGSTRRRMNPPSRSAAARSASRGRGSLSSIPRMRRSL